MSYVQLNMSKLTLEQKANKQIMQSAPTGVREIFLDAPAGTGKTYIITLTVAAIRSLNVIALALPSSGIVGILIQVEELHIPPLKLPSNMQFIETRTCNISKTPGMWKLLQKCILIVWDECTMAHKNIPRSLQDLCENIRPFGNAVVLLAGDFRQTLSVFPRSTQAVELTAYLKYAIFSTCNDIKIN